MEHSNDQNFLTILRAELVAARGCTEPIAIAFAGAKARELLGTMPEHCRVKCSGNVIKNVSGVVVPKSGGLRGAEIAAILGIVGGDPDAELDVLNSVSEADTARAQELLRSGFCQCELVDSSENLYLLMEVSAGTETAVVEISKYHTNITRLVKNQETILEQSVEPENDMSDLKAGLTVREILAFADRVDLDELRGLLEEQIAMNTAIAAEGLQGAWGASVGKTILEREGAPSIAAKAAAWTAAGSDARMGGCDLPVVINSGSGNQGITVSIPVYIYAQELGIPHETMLRALVVSNLTALHQKRHLGRLSAYCGVTSASCAAACGVTYMLCQEKLQAGEMTPEDRYRVLCGVITNTLGTIGGMLCDGAKSSCAAKIAAGISTAIFSMEMSFKDRVFQPGEGVVMDEIEKTISTVGRIGRDGMHNADVEILNIMLGH